MIKLILGPMFAGKSTELLRQYKKYRIKYRCLLIKYDKDTRYTEKKAITKHDKMMHEEDVIISGKDIMKTLASCDFAQVICVDEGQFFTGLVTFCETLANQGKTVIVSALDGDYKRESFGEIVALIPKSEEIVKIHAVCSDEKCVDQASFTKKINNNRPSSAQEEIGGAELYLPVCRKHYT